MSLEAATGGVLKKSALKNFTIFTRKHLCCSLFLIKLQALVNETPTQRFSCEYSEIFKSTYCEKRLLL